MSTRGAVIAALLVGGIVATALGGPLATAAYGASKPPHLYPAPKIAAVGSAEYTCAAGRVAEAQQLLQAELARRVSQLGTLIDRVNRNRDLVPSDRAALVSALSGTELSGIQGLESSVQADTTCGQLRRDRHAMFAHYRVYMVVTRQADLVMANDAVIHAQAIVAEREAAISTRVQRIGARNVPGTDAALAGYQRNLSAAQNLTAGRSAVILAQTPQGYPGNESVFVQARVDLTNARNDVQAARADLDQVIRNLS